MGEGNSATLLLGMVSASARKLRHYAGMAICAGEAPGRLRPSGLRARAPYDQEPLRGFVWDLSTAQVPRGLCCWSSASNPCWENGGYWLPVGPPQHRGGAGRRPEPFPLALFP